MSTSEEKAHKYYPHIDGLRAIAVICVLLFHYFPDFCPGGYVGVDVFFVISGFLITNILLTDLENERLSLKKFYVNRISRIFPALITVLIVLIGGGYFFLLPSEYELLGKHLYSSVLFYENLNLLKESGYFDLSSDLKPLLHLWSLSLEEQFYLFWPLIFIFLSKKKKWIKPLTIVLVVVSFVYCLRLTEANTSKAFYRVTSRFWELGLGGITAFFFLWFQSLGAKFKYSWLGLICIGYCSFGFTSETLFPGMNALIPVVGAILIITDEKSFFSRFLANKTVIYIGKISYPLYLWHWVTLALLRINSPAVRLELESGFYFKLICLFLSVLLAVLTYQLVEIPSKRLKLEKGLPFIYMLLTTLSLCGIIGFFIYNQKGFPGRFGNKSLPKFYKIEQCKLQINDCKGKFGLKEIEWCRSIGSEVSTDILILGDSHAEVLFQEIACHYSRQNRSVTVIGTGETPGLKEVGIRRGKGDPFSFNGVRHTDRLYQILKDNPPKTVILASRGPFVYYGQGYNHDKRKIELVNTGNKSLKGNQEILISGLRTSLEQLSSKGSEVIFVFDNFEPGFKPVDMCIKRPVDFFTIEPLEICGIKKSDFRKRYSPYESAVNAVLRDFPGVKTINPNKYLCDEEWCYALKGDRLYYSDDNHLSPEGVREGLKDLLK